MINLRDYVKKFIVIFIFCLCSVTSAKAKLEYNPLMDWYYWVEEIESETYRYHEDDIYIFKDIDGNVWCSIIE